MLPYCLILLLVLRKSKSLKINKIITKIFSKPKNLLRFLKATIKFTDVAVAHFYETAQSALATFH